MNYENCIQEMFGLHRFGIKLGLDVIENMLNGLGNPQNSFSCIHIAGTNGKGSVASALSSILKAAGYKVGLYTSPHLIRFNERICIDGEQISDDSVVEAYEAVKAVHQGDREPTFFEYTTAMALYSFGKANVDWAVIETGMGGRLDATNILCPELSVVTNISLEHRFYLGDTLASIAYEKGGIIKGNIPVITGATQKSAVEVLRDIADKRSAPFYRQGEHFRIRRHRINGFSDSFFYHGMKHNWKHMKTALPGEHQVDNAALVLAACEVLMEKHPRLTMNAITEGMANVRWPGRLEILPMKPAVIIDGAHNLMAARRLAEFLKSYKSGRPLTLVIGILDDKPYPAILQALVPLADRVIFTRPQIDRSLPAQTLAAECAGYSKFPEIIENVSNAVIHAVGSTPADQLVCIAGSLYVVGEAKEALDTMILKPAV